jgi:hypothetical protein
MSTSAGLTCIEGTGATSDGVDSGITPVAPTIVMSTAVPVSFVACIEQ